MARSYPVVLQRLGQGALHLSALNLVGPKLTADNHLELLDAASGKSKAQLQQLLAERFPAAAVPQVLRKLPVPKAEPRAHVLPLPLPLPLLLAQR